MKIKSSAFIDGGEIPQKYTCEGFNWNPPLQISEVPKNTKSLVLIMDDPDIPPGMREDNLWIHWMLYDIPPGITNIPEHAVPPGTAGKGTSGRTAYMGPMPPDREHRYFFKLYALDTLLNLPKGVEKEELEKKMEGHVLDKAELMGRYAPKKKRMT